MFNKTKIIFAIALTLVMCLTFIPIASADDVPEAKTAAITKLLKVPYNTELPNITFKFGITPKSVDGKTEGDDFDSMPKFDDVSISFDNSTKKIARTSIHETTPAEDVDYYYVQSGALFATDKWIHAGLYVYEIKEIDETHGTIESDGSIYHWSKAAYTVRVYVGNDVGGGFKIDMITTSMNTDDSGETIVDDAQTKVDPTPGDNPETTGKYSKMIFTNTLVLVNGKNPETNPENPSEIQDRDNWTLYIEKNVEGNYGDKSHLFDFSIGIKIPSLVPAELTSYTAYIVEPNTSNEEGAPAYNVVKPITIGSGAINPTAFQLSDNQALVFLKTCVGTRFTVTEDSFGEYTQKANVKLNNTSLGEATLSGGAKLSLPGSNFTQSGSVFGEDSARMLVVGIKENSVVFTNTLTTLPITGLNLNDLPFIGMIALVLGSIIVFVAIKARKSKKENQ